MANLHFIKMLLGKEKHHVNNAEIYIDTETGNKKTQIKILMSEQIQAPSMRCLKNQ